MLRVGAAVWIAVLVWASSAQAADWRWPVDGDVVLAYGNAADPYARGQHRGIDIAAAPGTPVVAAVGGTVRFAGTAGSSGLTVSIRSLDGRYDTSYLHLSAASVRAGQVVTAGERIGNSGTSGRAATAAPHLHFGVRVAGSRHGYRDPLVFLPPPRGGPDLPRLGPMARRVPAVLPPAFARPSPRAAPSPGRLGWAVACAALIVAALAIGGGRGAGRRRSRSSIGIRAVLRHHADLLRQR